MTVYEAAVDLIREADVCRLLASVRKDTDRDHRALNDCRRRYDEMRCAR